MEGRTRFTGAMEMMIDQTRQYTHADILQLTPPIIIKRQNDMIALCHQLP